MDRTYGASGPVATSGAAEDMVAPDASFAEKEGADRHLRIKVRI